MSKIVAPAEKPEGLKFDRNATLCISPLEGLEKMLEALRELLAYSRP